MMPLDPEVSDAYLSKFQVICGEGKRCADYVSKIVIAYENKIQHCTGTLFDSRTIVTSASCLPLSFRLPGRSCEKDIFIFFRDGKKTTRVPCESIVQISDLEGSDASLWRDDLVFLRLKKTIFDRRAIQISREGAPDGQGFTLHGIKKINDFESEIVKSDCESTLNSYMNPLSNHESSPNLLMSGCSMEPGFNGAPLVDSRGRVRALASQPISEKLVTAVADLLPKPLKGMLYATNFACAETPYNSEVLDARECAKDLNVNLGDQLRSKMLDPVIVFGDQLNFLKESLNSSNRYLKFSLTLKSKDLSFETEVAPLCFKDVNNWLSSLSSKTPFTFQAPVTIKKFRRYINTYGKVMAMEDHSERSLRNLQFFPKTLKSSKNSDTYMWKSNQKAENFKDLPFCL